jgi:HD superfamily phosphodiesterase
VRHRDVVHTDRLVKRAAGPRSIYTLKKTTKGEPMNETIAGITIPDTAVVRAATELVREASPPMLFNHCRRVYLFGSLKGRHRKLEVDPELLYVGAMFHDLGLTERFRSTNQRFEVDGADLARDFLLDHGHSAADARAVWLGIALHTTPGVPNHLEPETALVSAGVEADVLGWDLDEISPENLAEVVAAHPRPNFKRDILRAFTDGMKNRPSSTFGTMNDDVLAHFVPGFVREDFVDIIMNSEWPE